MKFPEWKKKYCLEKLGGKKGVLKVKELYMANTPIREIMKELGLTSPECIYAVVKELKRGPYAKRGKVTPEIEKEILRLREEGMSIPKIAVRVGLSIGSVHRVLKKHGLTGS